MAINIRPEVDETEIDMAISKLKMAVTLQAQISGTGFSGRSPKNLMKEWTDLEKTWGSMMAKDPVLLARFAAMDLPTVNRELRMILGSIPGMREWLAVWFRVRRAQSGVRQLMGGVPGPLMLVIVATVLQSVITINKAITQWQKQVRQDRGDYEDMFREGMDLTHQEWTNIGEAQRGFATWGEQFTEMRGRMGDMEATLAVMGNWWDWIREKFPGAMPGYGDAPRYEWPMDPNGQVDDGPPGE